MANHNRFEDQLNVSNRFDQQIREEAEANAPFNPFAAVGDAVSGAADFVGDLVTGQVDPNFKDVPGFNPQFLDLQTSSKLERAKVLGVTDEVYTKLVLEALGERVTKVEKDDFKQKIITYVNDKGTVSREYINKPGADLADAERLAVSSAPFLAAGGIVGAMSKGAPLVARTVFQGGGQVAASAAQDVGAGEQFDPVKGALAVGGGVIGETLAPAVRSLARPIHRALSKIPFIRDFLDTPGLVDAETGALTSSGVEAVERAGIDPLDLPPEMMDALAQPEVAQARNAPAAVLRAQQDQFGLPSSEGTRTKDPKILGFEEEARRGVIGQQAKDIATDFDRDTRAAAVEAISVQAERLGPNAPQTPEEAGTLLQEGLRAQSDIADEAIGTAFEKVDVHKIFPEGIPQEQFADLGQKIVDNLGDMVDNLQGFPNAKASVDLLTDFMQNKTKVPSSPLLQQGKPAPRTFDSVRRSLNQNLQTAERGSPDEKAALLVKKAYSDWIEELADGALESANPEEFAKLSAAIEFTADSKKLFTVQGKNDHGGKLLDKIRVGMDSPEGAINVLVPSSFKSGPVNGAVDAAKRLKKILLKTDAPAWHSLRIAYWLKMTRGEHLFTRGPIQRQQLDTALGQVSRNISGALKNQKSLMDVLYSPEELTRIRSFGESALQSQAINPNPSGTAIMAQQIKKASTDTILPNYIKRRAASEQLAKQSARAVFFRVLGRKVISILGARGEGIAASIMGRSFSRRLPGRRTTGGAGLGGAAAVQSDPQISSPIPGAIQSLRNVQGLLSGPGELDPDIKSLLR